MWIVIIIGVFFVGFGLGVCVTAFMTANRN